MNPKEYSTNEEVEMFLAYNDEDVEMFSKRQCFSLTFMKVFLHAHEREMLVCYFSIITIFLQEQGALDSYHSAAIAA